jgi:hypothetical protein
MYRLLSLLRPFVILCYAAIVCSAIGETIPVRYPEGTTHGFLLLRSLDGHILANGDLIQTVEGSVITSETTFHFRDGSLSDETVIFSQDHDFQLNSYHLVQKGPSFPQPLEVTLNASKREVTISTEKDGKTKDKTQHVDVPEDVSNGMIVVLLKNVPGRASLIKRSMLTPSEKPRMITLVITREADRSFSVAGLKEKEKAIEFKIHIEIGGVAGAMAQILGKEPPDVHVWISAGKAPTFIRSEGPMYEGGPIWQIELASARLSP